MRLELVELRARMDAVEHRLSSSTLRREDRAALERILPAIAGALGSDCFLASEAVASADLVFAGMNARRLGRLLRRADGVEVCGYVARASGMEGGAVLWSVLRVQRDGRGQV